MKFNITIGNPPYQLDIGAGKNGATALYDKFVMTAMEYTDTAVCMITPVRWFTGGGGLNQFRDYMFDSNRIRAMLVYNNSTKVFDGVAIAGGVGYYLLDAQKEHECFNYTFVHDIKTTSEKRKLCEFGKKFVRDNIASDILVRNMSYNDHFDRITSYTGYYDIETTFTDDYAGADAVTVITSKGNIKTRPVNVKHNEMLIYYRVLLSALIGDHGSSGNTNGSQRVLSRMEIMEPNVCCSDTYLSIGEYIDNREVAENILAFLKTKTVRFLVNQFITGIHLSRDTFAYIPLLDFSEQWTDNKLREILNITDEEWEYIDKLICNI